MTSLNEMQKIRYKLLCTSLSKDNVTMEDAIQEAEKGIEYILGSSATTNHVKEETPLEKPEIEKQTIKEDPLLEPIEKRTNVKKHSEFDKTTVESRAKFLLMAIIARNLTGENIRNVSKLGRDMGMDQYHINKATRYLQDNGYLERSGPNLDSVWKVLRNPDGSTFKKHINKNKTKWKNATTADLMEIAGLTAENAGYSHA